jgi:hypothetical protein
MIGAGITGVTAGGAELLKKMPHFLARTSGTSPKAMAEVVENPDLIKKAVKEGMSPDVVLKQVQSAVQETRGTLTKDYGRTLKKLAGEYKGQKMALTDKERGLLAKVGEEFGIDELKTYRGITDVKIGFNRTNDILKTLNGISATKEKGQSALVALREAKSILKGKAINTFGGKEGKYAELIKTYATQKGKYDQIAKLTDAWNLVDEQIKSGGAGKDLMKQASAYKRLDSLYREPNVEALKALQEFGETKGKDFAGLIAGSQFKQMMPIGSGGASNILKPMIFPLTSPRAAAAEARVLSKSHPLATGAYRTLLNRIVTRGIK